MINEDLGTLERRINYALLMDNDNEEDYVYYSDICNIVLYVSAAILLLLLITFIVIINVKIGF